MKIQFILTTISVTLLGFGRVALAQCPQICDLNRDNTALGNFALSSNTTGALNTAIGQDALNQNTTGEANTAVGFNTLLVNNADFNTAIGHNAVTDNTTGTENTGCGESALFNNNTGNFNTASGSLALDKNATGSNNTATGAHALYTNTTGFENTATGYSALYYNNGQDNTADGLNVLLNNTSGNFNTASGVDAMVSNNAGSDNTATGFFALALNTTGGNNTAYGESALVVNTTGSNNIAVGLSAGANLTTGNNNIDIGSAGVAAESGKIRIGTKGTHRNAYIAGISGVTVAGGVGVIIDTNGHLGTVVSSEHFKDAIKPMDKASEAILALKPVTFRYKHELDPEGIPQFGLVAEQVEKVDPDLVARDEQGKPFTVRYEAVNAMLLNEFLKEHRKVEALELAVARIKSAETQQKDLQATVAQQQKQIEALTAGLQKVSAQVEMSKPASQMVLNNQ